MKTDYLIAALFLILQKDENYQKAREPLEQNK